MPSLSTGLIGFVVNLLIGGAALHAAARFVYRRRPGMLTFEHAVVTALLGAVVWAVLSLIPLVGVLLALGGWVAVIRWRYPGRWVDAAKVGVAAWAAAVLLLWILEIAGIRTLSALGIPGV